MGKRHYWTAFSKEEKASTYSSELNLWKASRGEGDGEAQKNAPIFTTPPCSFLPHDRFLKNSHKDRAVPPQRGGGKIDEAGFLKRRAAT